MTTLPIRRAQFRTADFAAWVSRQGAEVCTPTNGYEVIRYRAYNPDQQKASTHIVYAKESGLLTFTGSSRKHYEKFQAGEKLDRAFVSQFDGPAPQSQETAKEKQSEGQRIRARILSRDGDECWYCGRSLGDDATIEHLVPRSQGGKNSMANYALAHASCNLKAANLTLVKKIELRTQMRAEKADA